MNSRITHLIEQFIDIQNGKPWIGSSFHSKLSKIEDHWVFIRPIKNLHSIAEIISHLTFWRDEAILKIKTGRGSKTDDCEENWLTNDKLKLTPWPNIKSDYDNSFSELMALLKDKDDSFLAEEYYDTDFKGNYSYNFLITGMLHHDIYHLGQLGIIIKFLEEKPTTDY
ncbi:MAG: DinB family protein [Bacteroidetes bacterium]|nr:MAG: DinB family protein [Bacteroidota bacterium]